MNTFTPFTGRGWATVVIPRRDKQQAYVAFRRQWIAAIGKPDYFNRRAR